MLYWRNGSSDRNVTVGGETVLSGMKVTFVILGGKSDGTGGKKENRKRGLVRDDSKTGHVVQRTTKVLG